MTLTRYLLDTNILSDLVRHPQGRIADQIATVERGSGLHVGHRRCRVTIRGREAECASADRAYAELRLALEQSGQPIGPNDMLIAAQALACECVLVTANVAEFSRVAGLSLEDWLDDLGADPPAG